jgi:osmoprotectant transport system substrate-binding protein
MDRKALYAACLAALLLTGCQHGPKVVVGAKNFTEQLLLGEIIAQQLERKIHARVERRLDLGGTLVAHQAIRNGQIDVYPEYTGTALTAILKQSANPSPDVVLLNVRAGYRGWGLQWLDPLGFNNSFAMVVRKDDAQARGVKTLSDAARDEKGWKLGVGYEFVQREDGLSGLVQTYQINFKGSVKQMDLGLLYTALEQHQVDMVAANATDGMLAANPFTVLDDDKHYFPPYDAALVVREAALQSTPGMREALTALSGKLNTQTMQRLNYEVDGKKRSADEVAAEFLKTLP